MGVTTGLGAGAGLAGDVEHEALKTPRQHAITLTIDAFIVRSRVHDIYEARFLVRMGSAFVLLLLSFAAGGAPDSRDRKTTLISSQNC
jgi:hypothetical protein